MSQVPSAERELTAFLDAVRESGKLWASVVLNVVAVRMESGELVAVSALAMLELRGVARPKLPRVAPFSENRRAVALQERVPLVELEQLIREVISGSRAVAGVEVRFVSSVKGDGQLEHIGADRGWSHPAAQVTSPLLPVPLVNAHRYGIHGDAARQLLHRVPGGADGIDAELRRGRPSRDGLAHLIRGTGAALAGWTPDMNLAFEVLAPLGVALDEARCELSAGMVRVSLVAASPTVGQLASVVVAGDDERSRPIDERVKPTRASWRDVEQGVAVELEIEVPLAQRVTVMLLMGRHTVQRTKLERRGSAPGALALTHALHVPSLHAEWRRFLQETHGSHAVEFARAVAQLFGFLGCGAVPVPDDKLQNHLDVLVRMARDVVLAVECTTSTLTGPEKMEKLIRRTNALRAAMEERGVGTRVIGVMIASVPQGELAKDACRMAAVDGIVVLGRQDLVYLAGLAEQDVDHPAAVRELIEGRLRHPLHGDPPDEGAIARLLYGRRVR